MMLEMGRVLGGCQAQAAPVQGTARVPNQFDIGNTSNEHVQGAPGWSVVSAAGKVASFEGCQRLGNLAPD